jgi:hypothetical protein
MHDAFMLHCKKSLAPAAGLDLEAPRAAVQQNHRGRIFGSPARRRFALSRQVEGAV